MSRDELEKIMGREYNRLWMMVLMIVVAVTIVTSVFGNFLTWLGLRCLSNNKKWKARNLAKQGEV
jgi:hypothetical protein